MKSWTQTTVLLVVFVLLVGGLTFVYQSLNRKFGVSPDDTAEEQPREPRLAFPATTVQMSNPQETNTAGHQDFWFENRNADTVEVGLDSKNCTCSTVELLTLTPQERAKLPAWPPDTAGKHVPGRLLEQRRRWQPLTETHTAMVPPEVAGVVRLGWKAKKLGPDRMAASLWSQAQANEATRSFTSLAVDIMFVPPLLIMPPNQTVPDLEPGDERLVEFNCWSPTHDHFKLEVKEAEGDPHFACRWEPLTKGERTRLGEEQEAAGRPKTDISYGYRVTVTIHEEQNGKHLDMGPFHRILLLKNDLDFDVNAAISGMVRGDVRLGTPDEHDRIELGYFPTDEGTSRTVPLESSRSGLELEIDSKEPSYLHVQLLGAGKVLSEGGKLWELTVGVPPNLPSGRLPQHSAVVLRTKEKIPRRIRIPVTGDAYNQGGRRRR